MTLSYEAYTSNPEQVADAIFGPGGTLGAVFSDRGIVYQPNKVQKLYAIDLMKTAIRGSGDGPKGLVTFSEAPTGVGKSLAILITSMLTSRLFKKPALISTFTRHLNRQISGSDGAIALEVATRVLGERPKLSLYRPRSAFASPTACRLTAAIMRAEAEKKGGNRKENDRAEKLLAAEALENLGEWTNLQLEEVAVRIMVKKGASRTNGAAADDIVVVDTSKFDGLIERFLEENPQYERVLDAIPFDHYTIDRDSPARELVIYNAYADECAEADVIICTHASLVIDRSIGGGRLDPNRRGYSLVTVDEANRLDDAGTLALGTYRTMSGIKHIHETLLSATSPLVMPTQQRQELAEDLLKFEGEAEKLIAELKSCADLMPDVRIIPVVGTETWMEAIRKIVEMIDGAIELVKEFKDDAVQGAILAVERLRRDIAEFIRVVDYQRAKATGKIDKDAVIDRADYLKAQITFSPVRADPGLALVPKRGARVIALLWNGRQSTADAVVITSATLATPGMIDKDAALASIYNMVGLSASSNRINHDFSRIYEHDDFGVLHEVILAHPSAPLPSGRVNGEKVHRHPDWIAYVTKGVLAALDDVWRADKKNRVVVFANSFADAAAIGEYLKTQTSDPVFIRRENEMVNTGFDQLEKIEGRGVLLTTGCWDGLDRPGLIDHEVIPRVPFTMTDFAFQWLDENREVKFSRGLDSVLKLLRQVFGRPFRKHKDESKIWILDPRIGLPEALQEEHFLLPSEKSIAALLSAFPRRFHRVVDKARIFPV